MTPEEKETFINKLKVKKAQFAAKINKNKKIITLWFVGLNSKTNLDILYHNILANSRYTTFKVRGNYTIINFNKNTNKSPMNVTKQQIGYIKLSVNVKELIKSLEHVAIRGKYVKFLLIKHSNNNYIVVNNNKKYYQSVESCNMVVSKTKNIGKTNSDVCSEINKFLRPKEFNFKLGSTINYEENWAKSNITHISPTGGGGVNNYTGLKTTPSTRILRARKKLIDQVYALNNLQIALVRDNPSITFDDLIIMMAMMGDDPYKWGSPPQFLDRVSLKILIANMKKDIKYTKSIIKQQKKRKPKRKTSRKPKRKTSRKPRSI